MNNHEHPVYRSIFRVRLLLVVGLFCAFCSGAARGQQTTLDEVVARVQKNYESFRSLPGLQVKFQRKYNHVRGARYFNEKIFDIDLARRGDKMFVSFRDDGVLERYTWNEKIGMDHWRGAMTVSSFIPTHAIKMQYYIDLLFYPDGYAQVEKQYGYKNIASEEAHGPDYWLPAALLDNRQNYRVLAQEEEVEGVSCVVVERPGVDKIWLDPARGFIILRRDFWHPGGKLLRERTFLRDYVEAAPNFWLPRRFEHQIYCQPDDPAEIWNQVAGIKTIEVTVLEVKPLGDEQFVLRIEDGDSVIDTVRKKTYVKVKDGSALVQKAEAEVRRLAGQDGGLLASWWFATAVLAAAALATFAALRWLRMRRA